MGIVRWVKSLGENTLYYPGCLTKDFMKEEFENYKEIFNRLNIAFVLLSEEEVCCGLLPYNAGYKKDARTLAEKNYELFKKHNVTKIVTSCPECYWMFSQVYPKLLREWDIPVEHVTVTILRGLKKNRINFKGTGLDREEVAYQDACYLGRYSGIYEEPREVIRRLGGKVVEMRFNQEKVLCCGAGGGVDENFPEVAKKAALNRVLMIPKQVTKFISPCSRCHKNFKEVTQKSMEFSSFVLSKLRGVRR